MRVRRLAAAGTAALLLPFAACSDGDSNAEPVEPTHSASSAAPSPSETASEGPTLPPEAQGDDEAAAKAFVEFYFELISDAMVTGDSASLRAFTHRKCTSCLNIARRVDRLTNMGATVKTKGWVPNKFIKGQLLDDGHEFYLRVRSHPRRLYDGSKLVETEPATVLSLRVVAVPRSGTWQMIWMDKL